MARLSVMAIVLCLLSGTALGQGRNTVLITADSGGSVVDYALQSARFASTGTFVEVVGRCDSACTLYLALPRQALCVGAEAYFRFHAPAADNPAAAATARRFMLRHYPGWVRSWIASQGGLTGRLLTMKASYARRFLAACESRVAAR